MPHNPAFDDDISEVVKEATDSVDRSTARMLRTVSHLARSVYGTIATCEHRTPLPIRALQARICVLDDELRAALVELHTYGLVSFRDNDTVDRYGAWAAEVSRVLGGEQGGPEWPWWRLPLKYILVSSSSELA